MKTTNSTKAANNSTESSNSKYFVMKCVAISDKHLTLLKVYAEDGTSVSLPKAYRETLTEGHVFECRLHISKDGRFYVADGCGKPKAPKKPRVKATPKTKEEKAAAKTEAKKAKIASLMK